VDSVLTPEFLTVVITTGIAAGVPLLFASLGEIVAEQGGVLNVGLEGMMLAGAFAGFITAISTGDPWLGLLGGGLVGAAVALIMVVYCIRLGMDQIVVGIGIVLVAEGATSILHRAWFARSYPSVPKVDGFAIPVLSDIPILGPSVFSLPWPVYAGLVLVAIITWVMRRTRIGLEIRAAGERPDSLDAAGVSVVRVRTLAELTAGFLAGVGGAYLSINAGGTFVPGATHGAGFIAIVIAMLARGRAYWSIFGALLYGMSLSIATALQLVKFEVPSAYVFMLPFVAIIVVLILFARQSRLPAALGLPYHRGSR